jgi:glycosyltransferase involved in cell wall biosynthesis
MRPERMLFVLSRVLGGKTFSAHIQRAAQALGIEAHCVFLDEADYRDLRGRIPRWQRATGLFLGPAILRHKLRAQAIPPCDAVFLQSFEILPALAAIDPALPVVLAHDSTNVLSYRLIRDLEPSPLGALACALKTRLVTPAYRPWLKRVRAFLPRTHWCAASLVNDFGVEPGRIVVTPAGIDLERWKPDPPGRARDLPVLLFVGNDFERKGGSFLLDLFASRLKGKARLRIISNDPALQGRIWPADVEHLSGLGHGDPQALVAAYRASDIFVFPTRKEHLGMVTTEACAAGLPLVATDVGGVREAVRTGVNGILVPYREGAEAWAAALLRLIDDPALRAKMGAESRRLAEREFGFDSFLRNMDKALNMLDVAPAHGNAAPYPAIPIDSEALAA